MAYEFNSFCDYIGHEYSYLKSTTPIAMTGSTMQ